LPLRWVCSSRTLRFASYSACSWAKRGFIDYTPGRERAGLIATVKAILIEYVELLPLTLRQLFYILVSHHGFEKTERAYKNQLIETVGMARRGRLIDMDAIRDDGFTQTRRKGWEDGDHLLRTVRAEVERFTLDRQQGQEQRLMLWCEAAGMVPQLQRVADEFSVQVCSSGGFDSLTLKHRIGRSLADQGPLEVLHIGDHDPSGVHMFGSLDEDVKAFADHYGGEVEFTRLAVTPEQVREYNLPTAPPKATDNRSFDGLTTQAEALDPRVLAAIVREAIEDRVDLDIYDQLLEDERTQRAGLRTRLERVGI
ncbi:MAG: hypothetical protein ACREX9_06335, partial [Gammaproteobacteria bacterium]